MWLFGIAQSEASRPLPSSEIDYIKYVKIIVWRKSYRRLTSVFPLKFFGKGFFYVKPFDRKEKFICDSNSRYTSSPKAKDYKVTNPVINTWKIVDVERG